MRSCRLPVIRIFTFLSLALLASHSFVQPVIAQSSVSQVPDSISPPPASPTPPSPSPSTPHPSTPSPSPSSTSVDDPDPVSSSSHSVSSTPSSSPTGTSESTSSQSSDASSSSGAASTPQRTATSSPARSTGVTVGRNSALTRSVTGTSPSYRYPSTTQGIVHPTTKPETTSVQDAATRGKSFFDNKTAVAGTFFAAGLALIGLVFAAVVLAKRRRRRLRKEEDEIYFEKYQESHAHDAPPASTSGGGFEDSSHDVTTPARVDAYPDRAIHHGWVPAENEYNNSQDYGIEYPSGTAYANAQNHNGSYQYQAQTTQQSSQGFPRTSPAPHPFADPHNAPRRGPAPSAGGQFMGSADPYGTHSSSYPGRAF